MNIKLLKIISLIFILIFALLFTESAFAQPTGCKQTDIGCLSTDDPLKFTSMVYGAGMGLIGGVGLLFIIFGGYTILTSQGNPDRLNKGKNMIFYAVAGIILAVAGYTVYQIIGVDILKIPGFN
jgi:hypothetical protein